MRAKPGPKPRPLAEIHGRRGTFVNRGCTCTPCREADKAYKRKRFQQVGR